MVRVSKFRWRRAVSSLLFHLALVWVSMTSAVVLSLRWVNPPTSAFMVLARHVTPQRQIEYRWLDSEHMSPHLTAAVVAAEDQRFFMHHGFDLYAIRSALDEVRAGGRLRGASTISQQVAKNLFLWPARSYLRKGLEAYFTVLVEFFWTKQRIVEVYLNIVEFGPGVFGVDVASQRYFRRPAHQLNEAQAALLAAVLPSPHLFDLNAPSPTLRARAARVEQDMRRLTGTRYLPEI